MDKIEKFTSFVKSQGDFHRRQAERFKHDERRNSLHSGTAGTFEELYDFLLFLKAENIEKSRSVNPLSLSWLEIEGLPQELIDELSITESDKLDFSIVELIDKCGGMASMDRILVEIYNLTGGILKRSNLNARLYRMGQKGMINSVPGKKGVYSTSKNHEAEGENVDIS